MKDDELVRDMYSRLNLIINELNSIGINKLGDADIVRKIISLLPQWRYGSIITILHNMEDLSTMTPTIVIGKIAAFEMSRKMCRGEEPTSSKPYAFACDERKGKKKDPTPSSSSEEEEEEESDDNEDNHPCTSSSEDEETIRRVGKVMGMIHKINLMGVPLQVFPLKHWQEKAKKERVLRMWGEGPLQGQLSKYGRTQKGEEQRQGVNKCQNLGWFFKWRWTAKDAQPPVLITLISIIA
jgi:hypothetical protein